MIGLRRHLTLPVGLLALATAFPLGDPFGVSFVAPLSALPTTASPLAVQDGATDAKFEEGVQALRAGRLEEALRAFQEVLAEDPGQADAYALWQSVDQDIWLRMLVEGGEMELVATRFLDLASLGRAERENDPEAIRALLVQVQSDDVRERTLAIRELAGTHGEYAVPFLMYGLADPENPDRRVLFMQALTRMGDDVVPPLIEGLESPDAFLRRNVALTLGYIGDPRANGELAHHAANDPDGAVRDAAAEALASCGGNMQAVAQLLAKGEGYYRLDPQVVAPHQISRVVWHWRGNGIEPTEVPRYFYAPEMAKKTFAKALAIDPSSSMALAALAGTIASQEAELDLREQAGLDIGDWREALAQDQLAVGIAGPDALDEALEWALEAGDATAASGVVDALGASATGPTPGLRRALTASSSGAVRGEAAVALARVAVRSGTAPASATVAALTEAVQREVVRIAAVIDENAGRRAGLVSALEAEGVLATPFENGLRGLVGLRTLPGIDAIVLSDTPGGVTAFQVLDQLERAERLADVPAVLVTNDAEAAEGLYGDAVAAIITGADGAPAVVEAMSERMNADREEANDLAARAAAALSALAGANLGDLGASAPALAGLLQNRPDEVALPALDALGRIGGGGQAAAVAAVVTDGERSDAVRAAAGHTLAGIFTRAETVDEATLTGLIEVCRSNAPQSVRLATATAIGRLQLSDEVRAEIARAVRAG